MRRGWLFLYFFLDMFPVLTLSRGVELLGWCPPDKTGSTVRRARVRDGVESYIPVHTAGLAHSHTTRAETKERRLVGVVPDCRKTQQSASLLFLFYSGWKGADRNRMQKLKFLRCQLGFFRGLNMDETAMRRRKGRTDVNEIKRPGSIKGVSE